MVTLGIDRFLQVGAGKWRRQRAGLVANQTSQTGDLTPTVDVMHAHPDVNLVALFGPEHGVRGDAQAGVPVDNACDAVTGLPVYSLYGKNRKPTPEMMKDLDVVFFDIQDAGVRFFTYIYTLSYVMEAAAEHDVAVVVLDRPNPINGIQVEGNVLEPAFSSFVGRYPMALRHGMTVGELAGWFNNAFGIGCRLEVVPMQGWRRDFWYDDTGCFLTLPGPNVPTLDTLTVYPGTCLAEGTNLSEGRGTTRSFELIGAPWIDARELWQALRALDLPGVVFRQACFTPTFNKYQGQTCMGVQLHVVDRRIFRPVLTGLTVIQLARKLFPRHFKWIREAPRDPLYIDLLMGTDRVRKQIEEGLPADSICRGFQAARDEFCRQRNGCLIYKGLG